MDLHSPNNGNVYELTEQRYENTVNGVKCWGATTPGIDVCFVKMLHYGHITNRDQRRMARQDAAAEANALGIACREAPSGVPKLLDHWDDRKEGRYIIVMEQARGISLRQWINYHPAKNLTQRDLYDRCRIIFQLCAVLQAINHRYPALIHRDLKPENIMVRREGNDWKVTVLDFGCTHLRRARNVGTIAYRAPEQREDHSQVASNTFRTDVFSLGQILYEMLLGQVPVIGMDYTRGMRDRQWVQCPQLPEQVLALPFGQAVDALLKEMTCFFMDDRPTYRKIMAELAGIRAGSRR